MVAMAAVTDVQRLQARVEELERWVYGVGGSRGSRKVSNRGPEVRFWGRARAIYWPVLGIDATSPIPSPAARPLK